MRISDGSSDVGSSDLVSWSTVAGVETGVFRHSDNDSEAWLRSPLLHMINTDTRRLRRRLTDPVQRADFPVFQDMAANGVTDYLAQLVGYGAAAGVRREGLIARWMTRHPDGFRDSDLAVFDSKIGRAHV